MTDLPSPIFQWINQHPNLSGLITFFISTIESVAIIGTIIPGSVMMTGIGALAGAGIIPLYPTLIWAILGAIVGDGISYWFGRYFSTSLPQVWPFRNYPRLLETGEQFFYRHGSMSVFIGRFVGPVRALVPLVAGMMGMRPLPFTVANIISAIGWAPTYMLPGILLGAASLELPPDIAVHAILMLLMTGLVILLVSWSLLTLTRMISRQIEHLLTRLWQWLQASRPLNPLTTLLQHADPNKTHGQLILAFYIVCALGLFFTLTLLVMINGSANLVINQFFLHLFRSLRTSSADTFMLLVTLTAQTTFLVPLTLTLSGWLFFRKRPHTARHVLLLGILSVVAISSIKHLTHSVRPSGIFQVSPEFSFPSGHATLSVIFFFSIVLLIIHSTQLRSYRKLLLWLTGAVVLLVGISRLYLSAHWFTDILGGWLLGSIILMVTVLSWRRKPESKIAPLGILVVTSLTLTITGIYTFNHDFARQQQMSQQIEAPIRTINMQTWWEQQDSALPIYRINRFGLARQILNLQWVGEPEAIRRTLMANGWENPPDVTWIDILHRITNIQSNEHLPLVAPIYLDRKPIIVLIKQATKNQGLIALRLWPSTLRLTDSKVPLWVGTIETIPPTYSWLQFRKPQIDLPLADLVFTLPAPTWESKTIIKQLSPRYRPRDRVLLLIRPKTP